MIPKKLNVGCGRDIKPGWVNLDISKDCNPDVLLDIRTKNLPWNENHFEEIYISGVLEQVGDNDQFIHVMNECHRVLVKGGKMVLIVPNAKYAIAHQDPMDVRKFTIPTFEYFLVGTQKYEDYGSVYGFKPWTMCNIHENERHILTVTMTK